MLIMALLLIGLAIWLLGVVLMVIGGLPIIFMVGKFTIEALVGVAIYKTIRRKMQEKQQRDNYKGLM